MNTWEWLMAVSEHPKTSEDDVAVAAAMILGDACRPEEVEGIDPLLVNFSIGRLETLGFLEPSVTLGEETIYELRVPQYK